MLRREYVSLAAWARSRRVLAFWWGVPEEAEEALQPPLALDGRDTPTAALQVIAEEAGEERRAA